MQSIAQSRVLDDLIGRLARLQPGTTRLWGTMSSGEMLCHLADASNSILTDRDARSHPRRVLMKLIALYTPIRWPRGLRTPARVDPRRDGTRPGDFESDRRRAIDGLRDLAQAAAPALPAAHGRFGPMTARDWHRWAYRHTDHHLRQFGL